MSSERGERGVRSGKRGSRNGGEAERGSDENGAERGTRENLK